jgi:hypothetical protein
MESIKEIASKSLSPDYYREFLRPNNILTLDTTRIDLLALCGDERQVLKTPTNGDLSLILRYKAKEGMVLSMETGEEELNIVQLQGSRDKKTGYKMATGFMCVDFFGDQVKRIVEHPDARFERITMPSFNQIDGLLETDSDAAFVRYRKLANSLKLRFSEQEKKFIKEINGQNFFVSVL